MMPSAVLPEKTELVQKYLGIPYVHQGRSMGGLDCYGLLILAYRDIGVELFDIQDYDEQWQWKGKNLFLENYHRQWTKVGLPRYYDVVLFRDGRDVAAHAGLMMDDAAFLHCARKVGVVQSRISDRRWGGRVAGIYRLKT